MSGNWSGASGDLVQSSVTLWSTNSRRGGHHHMENSKHDGEAVPRTGATCVGNLTRVGCFSAGQVFISI